MLAVNSYDKAQIQACRRQIDQQLTAYRKLLAAARSGEADRTLNNAALQFEQGFYKQMLLALDRCFVHRARGLERKDGNPLNEVRMLCDSIVAGHDTLQADSTVKYDPARAVLKLRIGEPIKLSADDFQTLADAFFEELISKYC
ncbi:MAG: hypothetical protein ABWZ40_05345 [Caulobacterales bacterium]